MIDLTKTCFFWPDPSTKLISQKVQMFTRIAAMMPYVIKGDYEALAKLPDDITPIVGCPPPLQPLLVKWRERGRNWIYWDRGYFRRNNYACDLPCGENQGYYRWHLNSYQLQKIRDVPADRWNRCKLEAWPWAKGGKHIVVAEPSLIYERFHGISSWSQRTLAALKTVTDRPIVIRTKEDQITGRRRLHEDLKGAHCLVTHGSNAAVESVIMGCPVFVHPDSAASLVGLTDLAQIESPIYPPRTKWLHSLAYSQFTEPEIFDGTLVRLLT